MTDADNRLLSQALALLDATDTAGLTNPTWTLGGGTALTRALGHRAPGGLDLFLRDAESLARLSPRKNPATVRLLEAERRTHEEHSNRLTLRFAGGGPADVIVFRLAPHLLESYYREEPIAGRTIRVETPEEILAKKLFYRADQFTARDLYDFAVLIEQGRTGFIADDRRTYGGRLRQILPGIAARQNGLAQAFGAIGQRIEPFDFQSCVDIVRAFTDRRSDRSSGAATGTSGSRPAGGS